MSARKIHRLRFDFHYLRSTLGADYRNLWIKRESLWGDRLYPIFVHSFVFSLYYYMLLHLPLFIPLGLYRFCWSIRLFILLHDTALLDYTVRYSIFCVALYFHCLGEHLLRLTFVWVWTDLWIMSLLTREHMIEERRNDDFRCVVYGLGEIYLIYLHTLSISHCSRWLSLHHSTNSL